MFGKCLEKIMLVNLHSIPLFKTNLSMATVNFRVKGNVKKKNTIYMCVSAGRGKFFEVKTGLAIESENWNFKKGYPKQNDAQGKLVFNRLKELDSFINSALDEAIFKGEQMDKLWLELKIGECFNRVILNDENLITTNIQRIIDNAHLRVVKGKQGLGLSKNRIINIRTFLGMIRKYELYKKRPIMLTNINKPLIEDFSKWLLEIEEYATSTAGKAIDNLIFVCNESRSHGISVHEYARSIPTFSSSDKDRYIITFSSSDQIIIRDTIMPTESLENAKKWLLIGCHMGQRGGDLLKIDLSEWRIFEGSMVFDLVQEKGDKPVTVPILEDYIVEIIKDNPPYSIATQNLNDYIKDVSRIAGFNEITPGYKKMKVNGKTRIVFGNYPKWELVTTHSFRRSFATVMYKEKKMAMLDVMSITRHSRESLFLKYINSRVDRDDSVRTYIKHYKKMSE
jgi:hypothetical protein